MSCNMDYTWLFLMVLLVTVLSRPIAKNEANEVDITGYLGKYGYLSTTNNKRPSSDELEEALTRFQKFFGLAETGEADSATISAMQLPRCSEKDVLEPGRRKKRYVRYGGRWWKRKIVYGVYGDYPATMTKEETDYALREAFNHWEKVSDLTFIMVNDENRNDPRELDIMIRFARGNHGDPEPFDGRWGVLAHAFYPWAGGNIHFDRDEPWRIGPSSWRGVNLHQLATHEIGHSLGLSHSDVPGSVMTPIYVGYNPFFKLGEDDIQGIQAIYGGP